MKDDFIDIVGVIKCQQLNETVLFSADEDELIAPFVTHCRFGHSEDRNVESSQLELHEDAGLNKFDSNVISVSYTNNFSVCVAYENFKTNLQTAHCRRSIENVGLHLILRPPW